MTQEKPPNGEDGDLYTKLKGAPEGPLSRAVGDAEGLDADEADRRDRREDHETRKAWKKALRKAIGAAGISAGCLVFALAILFVVILGVAAKQVIESGASGSVVNSVLSFIFGAVSAVLIEELRKR